MRDNFCIQPFFALYFPVREISRGFPLKERTVRVPLPFRRNRPENHSHNLGKALGEGLGLLCAPFTLSIPFTSLSLSPLYPFRLSIPFTSLSLSYLSLPLYISPSTFLFLSLLLSLFSLSFSLAYLMDIWGSPLLFSFQEMSL